MKKKTGYLKGLLAMSAVALVWFLTPGSGWALTNQLCYDCHLQGTFSQPHHNLPGADTDCSPCHQLRFVGGIVVFTPPDCLACHDFAGGPGAEAHNSHTALIPTRIAACETCHTEGVPGAGPVREPYMDSCAAAQCHAFNGPGQAIHDLHTNSVSPPFLPISDCATCHGADAPACVLCHEVPANNVPGLPGHDFRGGPGAPSHDYHVSNYVADCGFCHKSGVPGVEPVREPYTNSCAPCHQFGGPGAANHDLHTVTGTPNLPPIRNCAICHGPDAPVCSECHQQENHDFRFGPGAEGHDFHTDTQGITDCETCHLSGVPDVTPIHEVGLFNECTGCHYTNLLPQHGSECGTCHGSESQTVRQAIADNNISCQACHGQMPHAMDCMLCHSDQNANNFLGTGSRRIHDEHMDKTACGVCHEFRNVSPQSACGLCHSPRSFSSAQSVHREHLRRFDNVARPCFWCHGTDVPKAPANVCNLCHTGRSGDRITAHRRHGEDFACTICHDTVAGFGFDVRTGTPRSEVCTVCHGVESDGFREVHEEHLGKAQCFTCHGRSNVYAKVRGRLDCSICHSFENASFREVHREHVGDGAMCAVCHRVEPPSVQGVEGENSIPGYGTQPQTLPGPPTPGPGAGLSSGGSRGD